MMTLRRLMTMLCAALLAACTESRSDAGEERILLMGDSLLAFHGASGQAVSDVVEAALDEPVVDRAVSGARYFYILPITGNAGFNIRKQHVDGAWDWIILNGGGNDLLFGCGCGPCTGKLDRLISGDGKTGRIPGFVSNLRQSGARVIYVGYLRTPGVTSPVEGCRDEGRELERRIAKLAERDDGILFLSNAELVPHGDRSFHALDLVHPSVKGSRVIGERIAEIIRETDSP
ncbi:SGNH/GDSL hydrolase family protein [Roseovarius sp. SYSU LYC5161]|uniref:SGNH/GDSL hydrolase family protein n=1 Tax=Roseovarius halophilus (ex Wu et al. 2025) TaxID=3376060 RepID=UPI00399AAE9E